MYAKIQKLAHKYKNTCKIHYDYESSILLWKGLFNKYYATYTRSENHQQLKLKYANISMKITYSRIPDKAGLDRKSILFKMPTFTEINGNVFKLLDIIKFSSIKDIKKIEDIIKLKINDNIISDFSELNNLSKNLLKTILLSYSLFAKFLIFLEKNYKEFYDIIMEFHPEINKKDIEKFILDSDSTPSIEILNKALEKAIREEDYERASEIKRQIEILKNKK